MKGKSVETALIVLVILMFSGYFMLRSVVVNDEALLKELNLTVEQIEDNKWDEAIDSCKNVQKEWNRVKYIMMVNYGEADINQMEETLNYFVKCTENKDTTALGYAAYIKDSWENISKFVPAP